MSPKAEKVVAWLDVLDEAEADLAAELLSRPAELSSGEGINDRPTLRPCEHRLAWRRRHLCLACDNSGLRRATAQERREDLAYDPYVLDPPKSSWKINESESALRAAAAERREAQLDALHRDARIRAGAEVILSKAARQTISCGFTVERLGRDGRKVYVAVQQLHLVSPPLYERACHREPVGIVVLAWMIKGRLRYPPLAA